MFQFNKTALKGMILVVASFVCHVAQAGGNPPSLFLPSKSQAVAPQNLPKNADEISSVYVRANVGILFNGDWKKPKNKNQLSEIRFDLSPGESAIGVVNYTEHYTEVGIAYWEGSLKGEENGSFSVNVSKTGIISSVRSEKKGTFEINCNAAFICKQSKIDLKKSPK